MLQSDAPPCYMCGSIMVRDAKAAPWRCLNGEAGGHQQLTFRPTSVTVKGEPCVILTPAEAAALGRLVAAAKHVGRMRDPNNGKRYLPLRSQIHALEDALAALDPAILAKLAQATDGRGGA